MSAAAFLIVGLAAADAGITQGFRTLIALSIVAYLCVTRFLQALPVPQSSRQVPSWLTEMHPSGFLYFGIEMGTGMRTYSTTILPHVVAAALFMLPSIPAAAGAALGFASGRGLAVPLYRFGADPQTGLFRFALPRRLEVLAAVVIGAGAAVLYAT